MKISAKLAILVALAALGSSSHAQTHKSKAATHAAQSNAAPPTPQAETPPANAPPQPGWIARCTSASREAPLECAIEQTAVLTKTGQLIVLVNIRVPSDTHAPVALVQLPLFLFSATFFPISLYPRWLGSLVAFSPLYQSAALLRGLSLGQFQWIMLVRVGYLLALALVGLAVAARRFQRILLP